MSYIYYLYLGLVPPHSTANLEDLKSKLAARYAKWNVNFALKIEDQALLLTLDNYTFTVYHVSEPHVLEESMEIAEKYGKDSPHQTTMATCASRFEMYGDDDPNMDYFNDSLALQECLAEFEDIYLFDPMEGKFVSPL